MVGALRRHRSEMIKPGLDLGLPGSGGALLPKLQKRVLEAVERLHQRTGVTEFARRDIVS